MVNPSNTHHGLLIVIPARYESTRFPGKVLALLAGKPMVQWVWEAAIASQCADEVVIATDSQKVIDAAQAFGAKAVLTPNTLQSGTDRVALIAKDSQAEYILNLQADEPLVTPEAISELAKLIQKDQSPIATLAHTSYDFESIESPHRVKVVINNRQEALYFSREPIRQSDSFYYVHIGLYAFQKEALQSFCRLEMSSLEKVEKLEQLRALENGMKILVGLTDFKGLAVDHPEDLEKVERVLKNEKS